MSAVLPKMGQWSKTLDNENLDGLVISQEGGLKLAFHGGRPNIKGGAKGLQLKTTTLLIFFLWLVKSLKNLQWDC